MTLSETKEGYLYLDKLPEKGDIGESFSGYGLRHKKLDLFCRHVSAKPSFLYYRVIRKDHDC